VQEDSDKETDSNSNLYCSLDGGNPRTFPGDEDDKDKE
jgi:hypothetical protein